MHIGFQSQTRRLLPRNVVIDKLPFSVPGGFNRRRDACFPATSEHGARPAASGTVSIADATLASPQPVGCQGPLRRGQVSIADATLASPQRGHGMGVAAAYSVSIADATLASPQPQVAIVASVIRKRVSIADATLASPQPLIDYNE